MAGRQSKSGPSDRLRKQKKSRDDEERKQLNESSAQSGLLWDITGVIRKACTIHRLSGAQVWIPCTKQSRKYACPLPDENQNHCHHRRPIMFRDSPTLPHFVEACGKHDHLIKGGGVVGKAFATNEPWFLADISSIPKANYPLSEYARMFGIRSAVAVPLHIINRNSTITYVYEFFLPYNCTDLEEQKKTLAALILTLQQDVEKIRKTKSFPEFQLVLEPVNRVEDSLDYIESSSFPEENLRGPPSGRRLLPEPEPAEVFEDAIGQGSSLSMAVNETSHGTGEKTSLKDATGKGTGGERTLPLLAGTPSKSGPSDGLAYSAVPTKLRSCRKRKDFQLGKSGPSDGLAYSAVQTKLRSCRKRKDFQLGKSGPTDGLAYSAALEVQRKFRSWKKRKEFQLARWAALQIQRKFRIWKKRKEFQLARWAALQIQRKFRSWKKRKEFQLARWAALQIQRKFRSWKKRKEFQLARWAALQIQRKFRSWKKRKEFQLARWAALQIQRKFRSWKKRKEFQLARWAALQIQLAGRPSKSGPSEGLAYSTVLQVQERSGIEEERNQLEFEAYYLLLSEIKRVAEEACKTHGLPGAQVWGPCNEQSTQYGCRLSDENQEHCHHVMPIVVKNFPPDPSMYGFIQACSEHGRLIKGEGVAGNAFVTNEPWFSTNISSIPTTEYPLSEYASMFGMRSAVAVPLHIINRNSTITYVYEFFLPYNCIVLEEQMKTLTALILTLQQDVEKIRKTNSFPEFQLVLKPLNRVECGLDYMELSSFPEKNLRGPPSVRRLLPEPSYQNNQCPDQTPSIEPAEVFEDAIGQGSFLSMAVNEASHGTGEKTINVPVTSPKDATVKGTGGKSSRSVGIKRDWAWQYCSPIEGNSNGVICSFCRLEIKGGGITRFKSHIYDGDPSKNVKKCKNVREEVKPEIEKRMKGDYNKRK